MTTGIQISSATFEGGSTISTPPASYAGTIDSSTASPFTFTIKIADNPGIADAFTHSGWVLNFTDPRFFNGTFNSYQTNLLAQAPGGFGSYLSVDSNYYYFTGWFVLQSTIPQGTQFTISW